MSRKKRRPEKVRRERFAREVGSMATLYVTDFGAWRVGEIASDVDIPHNFFVTFERNIAGVETWKKRFEVGGIVHDGVLSHLLRSLQSVDEDLAEHAMLIATGRDALHIRSDHATETETSVIFGFD